MFCYQCEQTSKGTGCSDFTVCGKDENSAILQDLLVHASKGIAQYAHRARALGANDPAVDRFILKALFITVTNVNFDAQAIEVALREAALVRDTAKALYESAARKAGTTPETLTGPATWVPAPTLAGLVAQGRVVSILSRKDQHGPDINGLQELLVYGIKGAAAYADHAQILGQEAEAVYAFFAEALSYLAEENPTVDELLGLCLKCGEINLKIMEILDVAHTSTYGHPVPTPVRVEPVKGKAILISGHDLKDLEKLLQQTEGKGINIYTHGEMLPAHGYPQLKKYKHLVGNYGGAWQDQRDEFRAFPGAILMTTNCMQEPQEGYKHRIFTAGHVGWPGVPHIANGDFTPVIEAALAAPGFTEDGPDKTILVGLRPQRGARRRGQSDRGSQDRRDQALLPGRRLRRRESGAQLLHRVRRGAAQGLRHPDAGLRQVSVQQAGLRDHRRHPAPAGHRPMQRRLLGHPDRGGAVQGVQLRRQRSAAVAGAVVV